MGVKGNQDKLRGSSSMCSDLQQLLFTECLLCLLCTVLQTPHTIFAEVLKAAPRCRHALPHFTDEEEIKKQPQGHSARGRCKPWNDSSSCPRPHGLLCSTRAENPMLTSKLAPRAAGVTYPTATTCPSQGPSTTGTSPNLPTQPGSSSIREKVL